MTPPALPRYKPGMTKVRIEGHLQEDRSVLVCSGESPEDASWARDEATGHVFVVLEHIAAEDVMGQPEDNPHCFGLRLYGGPAALPPIGRILEVA